MPEFFCSSRAGRPLVGLDENTDSIAFDAFFYLVLEAHNYQMCMHQSNIPDIVDIIFENK